MDASYLQTFLHKFEHLKIKLEEIISATNNFDDENNRIGVGGFGNVYKGEVTHSKGRSMVAIKRLDPKRGQGIPEFLKEITMLSNYTHENLISLFGFCCEAKEMILVYELASGGSLDRHLNSPHLTWTQRVKICLDAAKGLSYLHDPRERHQRLIHCDIKSGNILLDEQWYAKVSDFGLSIMGSANEQQSCIVTLASGTEGYIDPQYRMTHTLTKESDVYSFGVVLFEVLCGTSCCTYRNRRVEKNFVPVWIQSCEKKELYNMIFKNPNIQPMDQGALERFSDIALRCLKVSREDRPTMAEVMTELDTALELQGYSENKLISYYREIAKSAQPPLNYISNGELMKLLSKGVVLNGGKTGEHCEMISFAECLDSDLNEFESSPLSPEYNSRFVVGLYPYKNRSDKSDLDRDSGRINFSRMTNAVNHMFKVVLPGRINFSQITNPVKRIFKVVPSEKVSRLSEDWILKTRIKTQFLSPGIIYTVNLVYKCMSPQYDRGFIKLKYKIKGETETSYSPRAVKRKDGCCMVELYQIHCDQRSADLEILFDGYNHDYEPINVEGIEFCPWDDVEYEDEKHSISDASANCVEKLPLNYEDIMKQSKDRVQWTTKKEAYSIMRKGFFIHDGIKWFSLDKNGKKCHIESARLFCTRPMCGRMFLSPESRFREAFECNGQLNLRIIILAELLSIKTTYEVYLIYKLPKDQSKFEGRILTNCTKWDFYLVSPLNKPKADQNTHSSVNMLRNKFYPRQRDDGWMEVQITKFQDFVGNVNDSFEFTSATPGVTLSGLIVEGLDVRPV